MALLHPVQHKLHQEHEHELNISGIQYPADIKDIGEFECQNNISINKYGYDDKKSSHHILPP